MNPRQKAFLAAYAINGNIVSACEASNVGRASHYRWMREDEAYQQAFADAEEEAVQRLEIEARRRATVGVCEPVIYQGELCFEPARDLMTGEVLRNDNGDPLTSDTVLTIKKPSDNLLMFLLKSKRPEKYRDNYSVEHTGPGGAPLSVTVEFVKPAA